MASLHDDGGADPIASRRALTAADEVLESSHGLHGYLSETHGFMPPAPPPLALPASHAAWDELAAELPAHFRAVSFRRAAAALPLLGATVDALPDPAVRRATTVLGLLAHAWYRVEATEPGPLPEAIGRPWTEVCQRLGRPRPFLEFEDITSANWRYLNPAHDRTLRVENLDLLVPTVGTDAERFFMLTLVELAARATPIVGSVVRAGEHMAAGDLDGLEGELVALIEVVRGLSLGLVKADPNPYSATHVDPVVWGITVAPFARSVDPEVPSPGGTAAALFQVLDSFLGRSGYGSILGEEVRRLEAVAPPLLRRFVEGVRRDPLLPFLAGVGSPRLDGLARALVEAYAGDQGLLQLHRIKAYGYLEVAFKVGRPITLSGFEGVFRERPWKLVDEALDASMGERRAEGVAPLQVAALVDRSSTAAGATGRVRRVELSVADQGIVYGPGDRIGVLPENGPAAVERVVQAIGVPADTLVPLTSTWRAAAAARGIPLWAGGLDLADFLRFARLRPLARETAKALLRLSDAPELARVVEQRLEDQLELWDALEITKASGYDVGRLVLAMPWEPESLAALVPPATERLYSISSAPARPGVQDRLAVTVGDVRYRSPGGAHGDDVERRGAGSHWLNHGMPTGKPSTPIRVVRPRRFGLPQPPERPVVMFAGGTGVSPFMGFLAARSAGPRAPNVLFYAARSRTDVLYREQLDAWAREGLLELHVALSRDDRSPRRIDDLIDQLAPRLWELTENGAALYICGQGGFAHTVMEALRRVGAARCGDGAGYVRALVGEQRLMLDVFTTTASIRAPGPLGERLVPASELVTRNDEASGYWMAIDGAVYDVTEFRHLHPGGPRILVESSGTDATQEYRAVLHHLSGEIDAMLATYKLGLVRRLDLGGQWGIAAGRAGLVHVTVGDLYRAWVRYCYLVVEMQNALRNDWSYRWMPLTRGEPEGDTLTPQKLMLMANTHERFVAQYLEGSLGDDLVDLWRMTTGLGEPSVPIDELRRRLDEERARPAAGQASAVASALHRLYTDGGADGDRLGTAALWDGINGVEEGYLASLKELLRQGLELFEAHESAVVAEAGPALVELLAQVPLVLGRYYSALAEVWEGWASRRD